MPDEIEIPDDADKIVPMTAAIGAELAIRRVQSRDRVCTLRCKNVVVDEKARTVICTDCGFVLDPFEYLLKWAEEGDRRMAGLRSIEIQRKVTQAEFDDLTRRVENMRQVLKRAGSPQPIEDRRRFNSARWNPQQANEILNRQP